LTFVRGRRETLLCEVIDVENGNVVELFRNGSGGDAGKTTVTEVNDATDYRVILER